MLEHSSDNFEDQFYFGDHEPLDPKLPTPEELALTARVETYTKHFQLVAAIASSFVTDSSHNMNSWLGYHWPEAGVHLANLLGRVHPDVDRPRVSSRDDVVEYLAPHRDTLIKWLNDAVNRFSAYKGWLDCNSLIFHSLPDSNLPVPIPEEIVLDMQQLQEQQRGSIRRQLTDGILDIKKTLVAFLTVELGSISEQKLKRGYRMIGALAELLESPVLNYHASSSVETAPHSPVPQELEMSLGRICLNFRDLLESVSLHNDLIPADLADFIRAASDRFRYTTDGIRSHFHHQTKPWDEFYFSLKSQDPQAGLTFTSRDSIFEKVVDACFALTMLRDEDGYETGITYALTRWLQDGGSATQHVEFMLSKAFSDPQFFGNYPLVMGKNLLMVPEDSMGNKKDAPADWFKPIGGLKPSIVHKKFGWGQGILIEVDWLNAPAG